MSSLEKLFGLLEEERQRASSMSNLGVLLKTLKEEKKKAVATVIAAYLQGEQNTLAMKAVEFNCAGVMFWMRQIYGEPVGFALNDDFSKIDRYCNRDGSHYCAMYSHLKKHLICLRNPTNERTLNIFKFLSC